VISNEDIDVIGLTIIRIKTEDSVIVLKVVSSQENTLLIVRSDISAIIASEGGGWKDEEIVSIVGLVVGEDVRLLEGDRVPIDPIFNLEGDVFFAEIESIKVTLIGDGLRILGAADVILFFKGVNDKVEHIIGDKGVFLIDIKDKSLVVFISSQVLGSHVGDISVG